MIVAFDHALGQGPSPGSEYPELVLKSIVEAGADAVLVTPGIALRFAPLLRGRISTILSIPTDPNYVAFASRLGCQGVKTTFFGDVETSEPFKAQEDVALACHLNGLAYVDEVVPARAGTFEVKRDDRLIQLAARKAAELGATVVKTVYSATKEGFARAVETTFIPVVILGGAKSDDQSVLRLVKDSMEAGGHGVAFGRNVWGRQDPGAMVRALRAIVHEGADVREAAGLLGGPMEVTRRELAARSGTGV